jgi:hypothetical protein
MQAAHDARVFWVCLTDEGEERLSRVVEGHYPERLRLLDLLAPER